jgi:ABC-type Fe3+-hydroxamate transport system substrate-binding protein
LQDKTNYFQWETGIHFISGRRLLEYFCPVRTITDQTGNTFSVTGTPRRIVSVVPSQTELLYDLGLSSEVAGITKFCVHPESWFRTKLRVGGTKSLNIELIRSLQPDLVIANKEENEKSQIEALAKEFHVWTSDIRTLDDARRMIFSIGELTGHTPEASVIVQSIDSAFNALKCILEKKRPLRAAYFIWNEPLMAAGGDTFISSMLQAAGLQNAFGNWTRYPEVTDEELKAASPDAIFLSSEPYPFNEKHAEGFRKKFPVAKVVCVDGELFSWYGSRLMHAPAYFLKLLEQIETLK